jgi:hypothetical protein
LKLVLALKKIYLHCDPVYRMILGFEYLGEFKVKNENALGYESVD